MNCPVCKNHNIKNLPVVKPGFEPGYDFCTIINLWYCNDCGVVFRPVKKEKQDE
jgi:rubredoxin